MTQSAMKKIAEMAQREPVDHAAYRAATEAGGDPVKAALAVGRAMGKAEERERRKPAGISLLDAVTEEDHIFNKRSTPLNQAYTSASYRRVRYAVQQTFGRLDMLNDASAILEREAYKLGFAAALRLLGECGVAVAEGQGEGDKPLEA